MSSRPKRCRRVVLGSCPPYALFCIIVPWTGAPILASNGPIAQIVAPVDGFKLRTPENAAVRIRVDADGSLLEGWTLWLTGVQAGGILLAEGHEPVAGGSVAEISARDLRAGERYALELEARDLTGATASAAVTLLVPQATKYTLIPFEPGNVLRGSVEGLSVSDDGELIAWGGTTVGEIRTLDRRTGAIRDYVVPLGSTAGQQLSGDGTRFFSREPSIFEKELDISIWPRQRLPRSQQRAGASSAWIAPAGALPFRRR